MTTKEEKPGLNILVFIVKTRMFSSWLITFGAKNLGYIMGLMVCSGMALYWNINNFYFNFLIGFFMGVLGSTMYITRHYYETVMNDQVDDDLDLTDL